MIRVKQPKQREWSENLMKKAVEFHGHGGPFMVIGLRMGLTALKRLNANGWFDLSCRVKLNWRPPDSCIIDGIQSSTGCTMGKNNLIVEEGNGIKSKFTSSNGIVTISLKKDIFDNIHRSLNKGEEEYEKLMNSLIKATNDEIFKITQS